MAGLTGARCRSLYRSIRQYDNITSLFAGSVFSSAEVVWEYLTATVTILLVKIEMWENKGLYKKSSSKWVNAKEWD